VIDIPVNRSPAKAALYMYSARDFQRRGRFWQANVERSTVCYHHGRAMHLHDKTE